jgi:signal transduction histidine kinase/ActR/RegA family two-component response regulator
VRLVPLNPVGRLGRYALATLIVAAATVLRLAIDPLIHEQIPYFIYVAAVVVATWSCGVEGGVLATLLAAVTGNYLFVEPRHELTPHPVDLVAMSFFSVVAFGLVWLVGRWKGAEVALRSQAERLRVLHQEAERANRVKDEFLATLSHELRTPLNAMLGWAHLLGRGGLPDERQRHAIDVIVRNAEVQSHLIEDVFDVSGIISGKLRLKVQPMDLSAVTAAALDSVRPAAAARQIDIHTSFPARCLIAGDADRLQQVAWNLLSNAVKFTPRHGRIEVSIEMRDSLVDLRVADTGTGINPEFLPHLFERFTQHDASTTRQHGGLGLGLAIVRHLVELHGGTVVAESPGEGKGATFTVTLPVRAVATEEMAADAGREDQARPKGAADEVAGLRVLVVDDESDSRDLVRDVLERGGAIVRDAASAEEAFDLFGVWRPDVLLADIGMSGEDGYSLIARIRSLAEERGGATPAGALTAYAQPEHRRRALAAGFQEHAAKPLTPDALLALVARLAGRSGNGTRQKRSRP